MLTYTSCDDIILLDIKLNIINYYNNIIERKDSKMKVSRMKSKQMKKDMEELYNEYNDIHIDKKSTPDYEDWSEVDKATDAWYFGKDIDDSVDKKEYKRYVRELR